MLLQQFTPHHLNPTIGEEKKETAILQTGLPGAEYVRELLSSHSKRIYDVLRIKKDTILDLC
jgi:hypothetical protein